MSDNPDQIRADIDRTRHELSRDVDALAEKVDPSKVVDRQTDKVRDKVRGFQESIMGSPDDSSTLDDAKAHAQDAKDRAGEMVQGAPAQVKQRTRGNPLAAGLIALGAGWLVGSMMPSSKPEQDAAAALKDKAEPLVEEAKSAAQEMGENLKPQAQEAAQTLQETGRSSVQNVQEEGKHHASTLKDDTQQAAQHVKNEAKDEAQNS
ncbi:DUF3618 domain-containing protein [Corynebacterium gallinarum]|uniref:DUF3618 domain-containing protein n=1 Tax=Corynebacterium gallinarum TaxID=2762214 RepID=A0A8I0HN88_9CORY|nr:DUF3618 domain-containing protein [Corynebacterium gallinarum]MBD8029706.1 DUF3618 domain-containing protein [Corynebacterium gallinarum]